MDKTTWFFVSTLDGRIETDDQGSPMHYQSQADAEDSIRIGEHGDYGTRFVIKAELETVSTATRPWAVVAVDRVNRPPADPFAGRRDDPPSPTGPGV